MFQKIYVIRGVPDWKYDFIDNNLGSVVNLNKYLSFNILGKYLWNMY
jgi:hypothetical protein